MYALPTRLGTEAQVTGVSCPDCSGVLAVQAEGPRHVLIFECRIRHVYDVQELLVAKEERLEERLWSAVTGLEELATLLEDLARQGVDHRELAAAAPVFRERASASRAAAAALRNVVSANRPIDLARTEPGVE